MPPSCDFRSLLASDSSQRAFFWTSPLLPRDCNRHGLRVVLSAGVPPGALVIRRCASRSAVLELNCSRAYYHAVLVLPTLTVHVSRVTLEAFPCSRRRIKLLREAGLILYRVAKTSRP